MLLNRFSKHNKIYETEIPERKKYKILIEKSKKSNAMSEKIKFSRTKKRLPIKAVFLNCCDKQSPAYAINNAYLL